MIIIKPSQVKYVRQRIGLTYEEAEKIVHATADSWESWENGVRIMHPGLWELFLLKTGQYHLYQENGYDD